MLNKFNQFLKETAGNVAMTGALAIIPIFGAVGMAVDYSSFHRDVSMVQNALDSAALATAKFTATEQDEVTLKTYAKNFFEANIENHVDLNKVAFDFHLIRGNTAVNPPIPTVVKVTADLVSPTNFTKVLSVESLEKSLSSEITIGNRTVEVALVLDNSGSMDFASGGTTRMALLKEALAGVPNDPDNIGLVKTIFNAGSLSELADPVKFTMVPFAGTVNVGTNNSNASWMDVRGFADIHHENLNWNTYQLPSNRKINDGRRSGETVVYQERDNPGNGNREFLTRWTLFADMGIPWAGCVEMRSWPYNTTDQATNGNRGYNVVRDSISSGDGQNSLFVPLFVPDMPDDEYEIENSSGSFSDSDDHEGYSDYWMPSYLKDYYKLKNPSNSSTETEKFGHNTTMTSDDGYTYWDNNRLEFDPGQKEEDEQHLRTEWLSKYQARQFDGSFTATSIIDNNTGPNNGCIKQDVLPLTDNQTDVLAEVAAMNAEGATNIQQGLTWGWRMLSSGEPYTEGRATGTLDNVKYLILLTDGQNSYYTDANSSPYKTYYGAWGFGRYSQDLDVNSGDSRISEDMEHNRWKGGLESSDLPSLFSGQSIDTTPDNSAEYTKIMDVHTLQSCENVKEDGITIFTIAFDVPLNTSTRDLLEACGGSGIDQEGKNIVPDGQFTYDVNGNELKQAMQDIALSIADMHIIK